MATSVRLLVVLVATISVILLVLHGLQMRLDHEREAKQVRGDLHNLTNALAVHARQTLGTIDRGVALFASRLDLEQPTGSVHESLRAGRDTAVGVLEFYVLDANGRVVAASYEPVPEPTEMSGEPPFNAVPTKTETAPRISSPLTGRLGRAAGAEIIRLARPRFSPDGNLTGWAVGTVSVRHFQTLFESMILTPHTNIALVRTDGVLLAGSGDGAVAAFGPDRTGALFDGPLKDAGETGSFWAGGTSATGERSMLVYSRVPGMPLMLLARMPESDVFARWKMRVLIGTLIDVLLTAFIIGATGLAVRELGLRQRDQDRTGAQLNLLADASVDISSQRSTDDVLRRAVELSRELVPSHQAVISLTIDQDYAQAVHTVSLSDKYGKWRNYEGHADGSGIYRLVCMNNQPMRLTQNELETHTAWKGFGAARHEHPPMRGWLAVPLIAQNGSNIGLIQLSDRETADFDDRDEAVLMQLAQMVSAAIENVRLLEARTRALAAAEQARDEIARIFSTMSDGLYHLDMDWRYTRVNRAAEEMFTIKEADVLGKSMWEVFPELVDSDVHAKFRQARETGEHATLENYYEPIDRYHLVRLFPGPDGMTVYVSDITDRRRAEQQLRQAQKMEAVGQLTGGVAHDFNNLLTVILGNADMLVEEVGADPHLRSIAQMIQTAAERGADLTHRLLAFSRRQPLAPVVVDPNQLVAGLEGLLRRTLHENIDIELVRGAGLWKAVVDRSQLENAVINIVINARDAMPGGGKLTIETANTRLDESYTEQEDINSGPYVLIAISDTGEGMDPAILGRAFDPFFTTKPVGKGSGLGLSMVYGFVRQSGGHVKLYSEPGYGTTVKIYLPRAADANEQVRTASLEEIKPARGSERIALVEDEELVRKFAELNLKALGYTVSSFPTGPELLRAMDDGLRFDLLFTDIVLPGGMNGRDIAVEVVRRVPGTKVLYSSGYTDNAIVHHGRLDDGVNLLNKPFRKAEMAQKVRTVLDNTG
ncbi:ATP-binding protein [Emcibacter sp. SYSU 3D8]|uniref:ATP-binding protein n=1 Tax=Emcibacter sp. SYSU 3D8 TaxID=3133969 RepID=UPI0031FE74C0